MSRKGREFDHSHYQTWMDPKELIPYPIHRRDLEKHLRRMKKELRDYDRFQQAAREAV